MVEGEKYTSDEVWSKSEVSSLLPSTQSPWSAPSCRDWACETTAKVQAYVCKHNYLTSLAHQTCSVKHQAYETIDLRSRDEGSDIASVIP